jgi:hypothetical protein
VQAFNSVASHLEQLERQLRSVPQHVIDMLGRTVCDGITLVARAVGMYEIYAYGNNDSLYGIFNAIAAIMGANSYLQAIGNRRLLRFVTAALPTPSCRTS